MENYILVLLADILLSGDFAMQRQYQRIVGTSAKASLGFNASVGFFTAIIFWSITGFKNIFEVYSVLMAILQATLMNLYLIFGFKLLKSKGMAFYTLFLMTGGMVVPYVWGVFFLDESLSLLRTIGLLLIAAGVFFANYTGEKLEFRNILVCIVVFLLNGFSSVVSKLHSIEENFASVGLIEFVAIVGMARFFLAGIQKIFTNFLLRVICLMPKKYILQE